jgi:ligand-binding sensor domain-containing protein
MVSSVIGDRKGNVYAICNASQIGRLLDDSLVFLKKNNSTRPSFFSDISVNRAGSLMVSAFTGEIFEITAKGLERRYSIPTDLVVRSVLFDSKDSLWLGTEAGVFRTSAKNPVLKMADLKLISKELAYEMIETSDGSVWMGLIVGGMRYQKGRLLKFGPHNGFTNFLVKGLLEDREGNIWFTTDGDGVYKFSNLAFTSLDSTSGLSGNTVSCLALTPTGKLWVSYFDEGMDIWDTKTNKPLPIPAQLRNRRVNCLATDNGGNTWVGLAGPGVYKISKTKTEYIPLWMHIFPIRERVLHLQAGKGKEMWISTSNGILLHDGQKITHFSQKEGLKRAICAENVAPLSSGETITSGPRGLNYIP